MAKTNNLTDFLTGLADKFRSKLGGTALINPQNFESKIDEVYQKGYDSAPQGVDTSDATAAADDVQNGKTFYAGGVKKTGSLNVTAGLIDSAVTVVDEPRNNRIYAQNAGISQKAIYNKNTKTKLLIPYEKAISAIGLTADKIVSGNTILGVAGTAQTGVDVSDTTATAADVVSSKVFYGADGTKQTGEVYAMDSLAGQITNNGGTISGGSVTDGNGAIGFYSDPYGFPLYLKGTGGFSVEAPYSVVAQAIGLTGDKIVSGETVLGVDGRAVLGARNFETGTVDVSATANTFTVDTLSFAPRGFVVFCLTRNTSTGGPSYVGYAALINNDFEVKNWSNSAVSWLDYQLTDNGFTLNSDTKSCFGKNSIYKWLAWG